MPSDIRDNDGQDHASLQEVARAGGDLHDTPPGSGNSADRPASSQSSAPRTTPVETQELQTLSVEESPPPGARNRRPKIFGLPPQFTSVRQSTSVPVGVPTGTRISFGAPLALTSYFS